MACVTLKRSLEFDPLHHGSCTPRPHKRRRCMPMCVSPQSAAAATARHTESQSPFSEVTPTLTPEQIAQNVREEIRRLKRRKILQCGERSMDCEGGYESPASPPSPASLTSPLPSPSSSASASVASLHPSQHSSLSKDKPLFTFRQVNLICEQLLRERETNIREEYDKVLASKLAEQYDCFVRFTTDQIQQRLSQAALPSYLS
ncbi:akirin-2-like [Portunus trituberculatus]|uniref:akirin-2-like n=1 Tax=Portunus trituberculatus TaxID=210409 RepID=UPI001E1CED53|nr:akirin-2-like [Portunus trituberculatus]XP_045129265.1 akirin-2-like [Portunus trituberculatus]XP_045129266.1 akirin-2-like [Portunus trituberculatus]XP_045129267.1 akirin-2-like [Portunus trituberculatus]